MELTNKVETKEIEVNGEKIEIKEKRWKLVFIIN